MMATARLDLDEDGIGGARAASGPEERRRSMARGGKRAGAGRKLGSPNKISLTEAIRILKNPRTRPERRARLVRAAAAMLQAAERGAEPKPARGGRPGSTV
jgi:hypothetical protein